MNAWSYLMLGIFFEVIGTTCLKLSDGFTQSIPSTLCVVCFGLAMFALSMSVKEIEIGVVYAIWSGVGITLITLIGTFYFKEVLSFQKLIFIGLIIVGVVGLQIVSGSNSSDQSDQIG